MSKNQANGQAKKGKKEKKGINLDELKQDMVTDVHTITMEELLDRLGTSESTGLTPADAEERFLNDGPNELTPPKTTPEIVKFLKQLTVGFNLLLEIGGILCLIAYLVSFPQYDTWELAPKDNLWLFVVLWVVALLTGTFSYFTEYSSGKVMQSFKKMIPPQATVIRGGSITRVESRNLVVGDLVEVKGGDRLPADIRVISASGFKVDNSSLTGESEPQARSPECTNDNPLETKNLAFFSTNALEGVCRGIVVQTGDRTVMGRIAGLTAGLKDKTTTLRKELNRFVLIITCLACFYGILFFVISMALGYGLLTSVIYLIGIIVANAPEGLLPEVAVALSITAKRLAARSCLVKNLEAVETLGSTSTICSDKTGTLTQNRMTVTHMWFNEEISTAEYLGDSRGAYQLLPGWPEYIRVAALCSRAEFREEQENVPVLQRICMGDASESAILKYTEIELGDTKAYRQRHKKVFEIPFNSSNKYQLSVHELPAEDPQSLVYTYVLVMKGAPERIYNRCDSILLNGKQMRLSSDVAEKFDNAYVQLGGLGERVIGLADCLLPMDKFPKGYKFDAEANNFPLEGLRFVGLISMIDPPRPAVPDAVVKCRSAGIRVIMVTGDHPITAEAIARSVGIIGKDSKTLKQICQEEELTPDKVDHTRANAIVVTGTELRDYSSDQLRRVLTSHPEVVFARTSPQQKLIIVEANQSIGAVVAVTGDGVNDSPALKRANIGIAMGIAGSEVTKEAANMVLMDDNFASIVVGIEEGRKIFDNIKKAIGYALTTNIPELVPFLVYIIGGYPLPLATISMLCISIGTDILPAIAFAHEQPESEIMKRKPRRLKDHMVTMKLMNLAYGMYGLLESFCGFYVYFVCYGENGWSLFTTFQLRPRWEATALNDLMDDYGQEWTYAQRLALQQTAQSAYFGAVVLAQWGNLLIFKTRIVTLFKHGMRNNMQIVGLFFETCVAFFVVYAPFINIPFGTAPFPYHFWLAALPYAFLSLFLDEIRKLILRRHPKGWIAEITAY